MNDESSISLKEHFEIVIKEIDKRYQQRFDAQERALMVALASRSARSMATTVISALALLLAFYVAAK